MLVSASLVLDIVFFAFLVLGLFFGVKNGFWRGICALAGTLFSLLIGVLFCRKFQSFIDETLGLNMTQGIQGGLCKSIPSEAAANLVGDWIAVAICFLILVALVRFLAWLIGKLGKSLVEKSKFFRILDRLLGGILGLVQAAMFLCFLLSFCYWLPWEALHNFIASSSVVGRIFTDWIPQIASFPGFSVTETVPAEPEAPAALADFALWLKTP